VYGMIGEDDSDVETLKVIVRRLANNSNLPIMAKGYSGCAEMLRKGARQLQACCDSGCTKLIVCYDSDGCPVAERVSAVHEHIVKPFGGSKPYVVVVPVQELESWILADIKAVTRVFPSWRPREVVSPELIRSPKEHLEKLSRDAKKRPRYSHATHNRVVARSRCCEPFRFRHSLQEM
jgi:Domain of unknown function (DUF4276)